MWLRNRNWLLLSPDALVGGGVTAPSNALDSVPPSTATGGLIPTSPAAVPDASAPATKAEDWSMDGLPEGAREYIKSLRKEAESHRKAQKAAQEAASAAENARLAEQGKYKELYEKAVAEAAQFKSSEDRAKELESAFNANLEARIKAVPAELTGLIPRELPPVKLSAWLDANAALLTTRSAPKLDAGATSVSSAGYVGSQDHLKTVAQRYNIKR